MILLGGIGGGFLLRHPTGELPHLLAHQEETSQNISHIPDKKEHEKGTELDGQGLLDQAIVSLESRLWVAGKIRYYFEMFNDVSVEGKGTYLAHLSESGQCFRWELILPQEDQGLRWWELFDGQTLWTYRAHSQDENPKENLSRVDVLQVAQHLKKEGNLPKIGEIGNWPGLGGLPRLLRSLQANFQFTVIENTSVRITDGQKSRYLPVWRLLGVWKPDRLAQLLPDQADRIRQGLPVRWENVPPHLPDHVFILLGQEDMFPYEIHYRRKPSGRWTAWLTQFAWFQPQDQTLAKLEFVELSLNVPLPADTFTYQPPPQLAPSNATQEFIQQLQKKMKK